MRMLISTQIATSLRALWSLEGAASSKLPMSVENIYEIDQVPGPFFVQARTKTPRRHLRILIAVSVNQWVKPFQEPAAGRFHSHSVYC